jgi:hypothetical protein
MRLQEYDLDIQHRKGKKSGNVDGMTRSANASTCPYDEDPVESLYTVEPAEFLYVTTRARAAKPHDERAKTLSLREMVQPEGELTEGKATEGATKVTGDRGGTEAKVAESGDDEKHADKKEPGGFFGVKDEKAETKEEFIAHQNAHSPFMDHVRDQILTNKDTKYFVKNGVIVWGETEGARAVVPLCLRAWILRDGERYSKLGGELLGVQEEEDPAPDAGGDDKTSVFNIPEPNPGNRHRRPIERVHGGEHLDSHHD